MKASNTENRRRPGKRVLACALLSLASVLTTAGVAATFPDLYTVSVPPDPAAADARAAAEQRAMEVLLTRITGRREPASQEEMAGLIRSAGRYVTSYQSAVDEVRIGFSRSGVNEVLDSLSLPVWGAERPSTLVWIAVDLGEGLRTELMADTTTPGRRPGEVLGASEFPLPEDAAATFDAIRDEVLAAADERGLPIVLPLLDEADRLQVRFADVWGGFDDLIARAAERYAVDAVLVGRVAVTSVGYEVRWTLLRGDRRQTVVTADLRSGVDWLADEFAAQFITVGGASLTWITVHGIETWPDYGRVFEYLQSVSVIDATSVVPESWSHGSLLIRLAARGDDSALRQVLALDGVLRAAPSQLTGTTAAEIPGRLEFVPGWQVDPGATRGL